MLLRALLIVGGAAWAALGTLSAVAAIEGANGPTARLTTIGFVWEFIFATATVPMIAAMVLASRSARSGIAWVLLAFGAIFLTGAAVVAILRLAGVVDVLLPLVNWVPGTVCVIVWGWLAARGLARQGVIGGGFVRSAAGLAISEIAALVLAGVAVAVTGTREPLANVVAGVAGGAILVGVGVWWIALAVRWEERRRRTAWEA